MKLSMSNGALQLAGDITVKTVNPTNYACFQQQCRLKEVHTLDLAAVQQADSACVSLLLAALRLRPNGLALRNIPASVVALADLYEIKDWVKE